MQQVGLLLKKQIKYALMPFSIKLPQIVTVCHSSPRRDQRTGGVYLKEIFFLIESTFTQLSSLACILGCRKVVQASSTDPCALTTRSTGWHASIWAYQNKICGILLVIAEDLKHVLHSNRVVVDAYLSDPVFSKLDLLIRSVVPPVNHDAELERRMSAYVQREEQRMEQNLLAVAFDIDDQNTLSLITGPGRIERVRADLYIPLAFKLMQSF